MFEIKYEFKKAGEEYSCKYPLPKDKNNCFFLVKGTNDQGKSTLMQMIALGLHGLDSDDIDENLKVKMRRLVSKEVDNCKFDFTIKSVNQETTINSQLDNTVSPRVFINGNLKPKDFILKNFKILYDIPENPMKKLSDSLKLMGDNFKEYEHDLQIYSERIGDVIQKIDEYEQKEESLKNTRISYQDLKSRLSNLEYRHKEIMEEYEELEKNVLVHSYYRDQNGLVELDRRLKEKNALKKELKDKGVGGGSIKYRKAFSEAVDLYNDLKEIIKETKKSKDFLDGDEITELNKIFKKLDSIQLADKNIEKEVLGWFKFYDGLARKLRTHKRFKQDLPEEREMELFEKLIKTLGEFIEFNITIPGTEGKTISKFIRELEKEQKEKMNKIADKIELKEIIQISDKIGEKATHLAKLIPIISGKTTDESTITLKDIENEIKKIEAGIQILFKKQVIEIKKIENIPQVEKYKILSEKSKDDEFNRTQAEKVELEDKIGKIKIKISNEEAIIKKLEKIEKPLKIDRATLLKEDETVNVLLRKIQKWKELIKKIDQEKMNILELKTEPQIDFKFYDALGDYFAGIVKKIYRKHEEFKLKKIDIIHQKYIVENREPIDFNDMGTGHSALASLLTKLRTDFPGKKKIVLFDEISDMDAKNIKILLNEIKNQIKEGKIIFALLTEKDDNLEKAMVTPIELG